jgi:DNA-binding LacI/PurR family transcriptional regulator
MGRKAVEMLLSAIESGESGDIVVVLKAELKIRKSTARPRIGASREVEERVSVG